MGERPATAVKASRPTESVGDSPLPSLVIWGLTMFHVTMLTLVLVVTLHLGGTLGSLLSGLDTMIGLTVFAFLWAVTWWTNRRALRGAWRGDGFDPRSVVLQAVGWGGVTGTVFFVGPFGVLLALLVVNGGGALATVAVGAVGALIAAVIGALVGGMLGLVDLFLFWTAGELK